MRTGSVVRAFRGRGALVGGLAAIVAGIALMAISGGGGGRFETNGERIYFTGRNQDGERIAYRGGAVSGMMMARGLACASCHGGNAQGGRHQMHMFVMDAPSIRWSALTTEVVGEGAVYDLAAFRRAVVDGQHPGGGPLSDLMPRWTLSDRDLDALATFLKSLDQ